MGLFSNLVNNHVDVSFIQHAGFTWKWGISSLSYPEGGQESSPCLHSYMSGASKEERLSKSEIIDTKVL